VEHLKLGKLGNAKEENTGAHIGGSLTQ